MSEVVAKASIFAAKSHAGQFRKYSDVFGLAEPYINHPARVVAAVSGFNPLSVDPEKLSPFGKACDDIYRLMTLEHMLAAAWCHDVIEDCEVDAYTLVNATSPACAKLVCELTNPSKGSRASRAERKKMDRDHIRDISDEAKIIKAFDRIDNIMGIVNAPKDFATLYLSESRLLAEVLTGVPEHILYSLMNTIRSAEIFLTGKGK